MSRRIRVLHLVTRLDLGGAQRNTLHTVATLDRSEFEPVLACGRGGILDGEARALEPGVRVLFVDSLVRELSPARDLAALLQLRALLEAERPDVLHTHSSKAGVLGRLAARLAGIPVVVHTFHGFGFHDRQSAPVRALYLGAERLSAGLADRLVFVSRSNMRDAERLGLGEDARRVLIRSGVRLSDFPAGDDPAAVKAGLGLAPTARLVLSVGNLKPQKNAFDLLRAAERVLAAEPAAAFALVGDGPLRGELEAAVRARGLSGRFLLPGWRRDVPALLAAADVFALSSLWEGLPRALVEAMKSARPCVCYATDGVTDLLEDGRTGLLAEPGDSAALAEGVLRLLRDRALAARLGSAAAAAIGPEFDIDGMVRSQEELYRLLLAEKGLRPAP